MRPGPKAIVSYAPPMTILEVPDYLDGLCPEYAPKPGDTIEKIMFEAGRRSVALQIRAAWLKGGDA